MSVRTERMAETLRELLMDIIQKDLKDPAIGITSVTHVKVSPDLKRAWVYLSILGDEEAVWESLKAFAKARGHIRAEIGKRARLRVLPELSFESDVGIEQSMKVSRILKEMKEEEDGR